MYKTADSLQQLLQATREVVSNASDLLVEMSKKDRNIQHKGRIDLVTETDLAVEVFLQQHLQGLVPNAVLLAEESAVSLDIPGKCWIIDPVDGTTNYAHGLPLVAISVAYCEQGIPLVGVVSAPLMGENWYAAKGQGAYCNGKRITVSTVNKAVESLSSSGCPYNLDEKIEATMRRLRNMLLATRGVRRCGAAALDLAWVAGGRFDSFFHTDLKPWDIAAGMCLVVEAGGRISRLDGSAYTLEHDDIVATNSLLHDEVIALLNR